MHLITYTNFDFGKFDATHSFNDRKADYSYLSVVNISNFQSVSLSDTNGITISGKVRMPNDKKVTNVFSVINSILPNHPDTMPVDNSGRFTFQVPPDLDYTITIFRDANDYLNGVSTLDMVLIGRHILGVQPLASRWQWTAADVNNDKRISVLDMVDMRKLILGAINKWAAPSWWFFDASVAEEDPFANQIPTFLYFENLKENVDDANFIAVKTGDVNYTAVSYRDENKTEIRAKEALILIAEDRMIKKGESFVLPILSKNFHGIFGFQFSLEMNGLNVKSVESGFLEMDDLNYAFPKNNVMTMSWNDVNARSVSEGEILFLLDLSAERDGLLSEMLTLSSIGTTAEAYSGPEMKIVDIDLEFRKSNSINNIDILNASPNPFKEFTVLKYSAPKSGEVVLSVFDNSGRILLRKKVLAIEGLNEFIIPSIEIGGKGILVGELEQGGMKNLIKLLALD